MWTSRHVTYVHTDEEVAVSGGGNGCLQQKDHRLVDGRPPGSELGDRCVEMALHRRRPAAGLMVHSDRGVQYACQDYQGVLARNQLVCSMSRRGNCYDNRDHRKLPRNAEDRMGLSRKRYATREEARRSILSSSRCFTIASGGIPH